MAAGCRAIRASFCVIVLAAGCGHSGPSGDARVAVDLLAAFPATGGGEPTTAVRADDPGARRHLLSGWSVEDGVMWASGTRAGVWFQAARPPVDETVVVDTVPGTVPGREPLVQVRLNRRSIARFQPADDGGVHPVALPAALQLPGRNVLELVALRGSPAEPPARRFGVRALRFAATRAPAPAPHVRDDALVVPAGTSATYFVALPPAAWLVYEPDAGTPPAVAVETDGGTERTIVPARTADGATMAADLAAESGAAVRLTIAAREGVVLRRPRIVGAPAPPVAPPRRAAGRPNVVLYLIDTLRADRLGCYGYPRPTSPHLDALARDGVVFERVAAQSSWTRPATASILTGRDPHDHHATSLMDGIRPGATTLSELLHRAGWATAGFVTNLNVGAQFGFARGFDEYQYLAERDDRDGIYAPAAELNAAVLPWLAAHAGRPFFLYVHATDPHAPYRPSPEDAARFVPAGLHPTIDARAPLRRLIERPDLATPDDVALVSALYDAEIAGVDAAFGALRDELRRLGLDDRTLVVVLADHGEEFRDHGGFDHGRTLYDELVRIPLIVRLPGGAGGGRRVRDLVRQIDVLPTILALVGVDAPDGLPGVPLLDAGGASWPVPSHAIFETELTGRRLSGFSDGRWKAIWDASAGRDRTPELYDLAADPHERASVAAAHPVIVGYAAQAVEREHLRVTPDADTRVDDPALEQRLRALGYVGSDE